MNRKALASALSGIILLSIASPASAEEGISPSLTPSLSVNDINSRSQMIDISDYEDEGSPCVWTLVGAHSAITSPSCIKEEGSYDFLINSTDKTQDVISLDVKKDKVETFISYDGKLALGYFLDPIKGVNPVSVDLTEPKDLSRNKISLKKNEKEVSNFEVTMKVNQVESIRNDDGYNLGSPVFSSKGVSAIKNNYSVARISDYKDWINSVSDKVSKSDRSLGSVDIILNSRQTDGNEDVSMFSIMNSSKEKTTQKVFFNFKSDESSPLRVYVDGELVKQKDGESYIEVDVKPQRDSKVKVVTEEGESFTASLEEEREFDSFCNNGIWDNDRCSISLDDKNIVNPTPSKIDTKFINLVSESKKATDEEPTKPVLITTSKQPDKDLTSSKIVLGTVEPSPVTKVKIFDEAEPISEIF